MVFPRIIVLVMYTLRSLNERKVVKICLLFVQYNVYSKELHVTPIEDFFFQISIKHVVNLHVDLCFIGSYVPAAAVIL